MSGTTPKFDCALPNGEKIKVKYSCTREIPSETAASRLLHAFGIGADSVSRVETVRCHRCPFQPFHTRALLEMLSLERFVDRRIDYSSYRDFKKVSVERNLDGEAIEVGHERVGVPELKKIDPSRGGATRAEVDALRLMAVFLHHWDNKSSNQRLTCPNAKKADCEHPLAMIQDVGSEFGPKKAELENWRSKPVWHDSAKCLVSMKGMPYNGGTFEDVAISEGGRRLLADRLRQLSQTRLSRSSQRQGSRMCPRGPRRSRTACGKSSNGPRVRLRQSLPPDDLPAIDRFSHPVHGAEVHRVAQDLDEQEAEIAIVAPAW